MKHLPLEAASLPPFVEPDALLRVLNQCYPLTVERITLHRDMIGWVYIADGAERQYVLKCYRPFDTDSALRAIAILQYLRAAGFPVVSLIPTRAGGTHILLDTPGGQSVAVLFDFVAGAEPDRETELPGLAQMAGRLHRRMERFPGPQFRRGKDFYIDRYIDLLRQKGYPARRIDALDALGSALWQHMARLPAGFCHGDLHTGNMRQTAPGAYTLFDFDAASFTSPVVDVATFCDASNFNVFDPAAFPATRARFERFYAVYGKERALSDAEIAAILPFVAIRHYEIIATIVRCQGLAEVSMPFLDEQYDWLLRWGALCEQHSL